MVRTKILALVALLAAASAASTAGTAAGRPPVRVVADMPMLFRGTSPAVNVTVNGKGPFLFMIDTGGQGKARADVSLVGQLGIAPVAQAVSGDGSGRNDRRLDVVEFDRLDVGGVEFRHVPALSREYNRSAKLPPIAGILGYNLFDGYLLTLDFIHKRVRLEAGALPPADGKTVLDYEAPYDTPIVEMTMAGLRLVADVDSGDIGGISFPQALVQALPHIGEPKVVGTGRTISNEFEVSEVKLRGVLRLGEHELADPVVRFNPIHDNINLGAGFLAGYIVTFDQKNRRVRIVGRPE
ncbi:MAG: hypothetical protein QOG84_1244 [Sphingomonadales bacterium]|jgi:hypothetical protein|nr:hypothetical protein [Sphingomonadales bacterium]